MEDRTILTFLLESNVREVALRQRCLGFFISNTISLVWETEAREKWRQANLTFLGKIEAVSVSSYGCLGMIPNSDKRSSDYEKEQFANTSQQIGIQYEFDGWSAKTERKTERSMETERKSFERDRDWQVLCEWNATKGENRDYHCLLSDKDWLSSLMEEGSRGRNRTVKNW